MDGELIVLEQNQTWTVMNLPPNCTTTKSDIHLKAYNNCNWAGCSNTCRSIIG